MLVGYMRVSKADGSQTLDLQRDALLAAGVEPGHLYEDLHPYIGEFVWMQENNYFGWRSLLGEEPGSAGVSPLRRPRARPICRACRQPTFRSTVSISSLKKT